MIGGELRGRRLAAPSDASVRPTSDRVREAIFDILFSRGGVEGAQVVDLFAGSGALGIEALSRGAASVTFVERHPEALAAIRANLDSVGLADAERDGEATVVRADVDSWVATTASRYDLALVDPPYRYEDWGTLVAPFARGPRRSRIRGRDPLPEGWVIIKSKHYGGTIVTVARPEPVTGTSPEVAAEKGAS